jgi:hypothetical protein
VKRKLGHVVTQKAPALWPNRLSKHLWASLEKTASSAISSEQRREEMVACFIHSYHAIQNNEVYDNLQNDLVEEWWNEIANKTLKNDVYVKLYLIDVLFICVVMIIKYNCLLAIYVLLICYGVCILKKVVYQRCILQQTVNCCRPCDNSFDT